MNPNAPIGEVVELVLSVELAVAEGPAGQSLEARAELVVVQLASLHDASLPGAARSATSSAGPVRYFFTQMLSGADAA